MHNGWKRQVVLAIVLALVLALGAVFYTGCGGGSGDYTKAVLSEWSSLEGSTDELVETSKNIEAETDLEDLSDVFKDTLDTIATFQDKLDSLKVPSELQDSNEALDDFLSAYDDYLSSTADFLDEVMGGNLDAEMPDSKTLVEDAQSALEDYQDTQDYNEAELDDEVWDLGDLVLGIFIEFYGGEDKDDPKFAAPLETLDNYYIAFNQGDGETMLALIDIASPILSNISEEFFLAQVGEAYIGGLQAEGTVEGVESYTDEEGNWVTVYMSVDYTETLDMEGNIVPAHSENLIVDLYEYNGEWYIFDLTLEDNLEEIILF